MDANRLENFTTETQRTRRLKIHRLRRLGRFPLKVFYRGCDDYKLLPNPAASVYRKSRHAEDRKSA